MWEGPANRERVARGINRRGEAPGLARSWYLVASIVPTPAQGFNNNVRHRGRVFHVQTEDSGVKSPRIVTHLFADGGRIIKTIRTEYSEHVTRSDMQTFVRALMKEQHKAMFMALRLGELDALLETVCGPFEQHLQVPARTPTLSLPPNSSSPKAGDATPAPDPLLTERSPALDPSESTPSHAAPPRTAPPRATLPHALGFDSRLPVSPRTSTEKPPVARPLAPSTRAPAAPRTLRPGLTPTLASALGPALPARPDRSHELVSVRPRRTSNPPQGRAPRPSVSQRATEAASVSRPSTRFAEAPSTLAPSLFGEGVIREQSLDEVILSYLAEDAERSLE
jgi:hypothetical protein